MLRDRPGMPWDCPVVPWDRLIMLRSGPELPRDRLAMPRVGPEMLRGCLVLPWGDLGIRLRELGLPL